MQQKLKVGGIFRFQHIRDGKVIDEWQEKNIVPDEGLAYILGTSLDGATTPVEAGWFVGLFSGNYTPLNTDTAANISANSSETTTAYSEANRVDWVQAGVTANLIGNSASVAVFTFVDPSTNVYGGFLVSSNVKGGTAGVLAAASRFDTLRVMLANDKLNVTYEITAASS